MSVCVFIDDAALGTTYILDHVFSNKRHNE